MREPLCGTMVERVRHLNGLFRCQRGQVYVSDRMLSRADRWQASTNLIIGRFPERSRGRGRLGGASPAGLPLDGDESKGNRSVGQLSETPRGCRAWLRPLNPTGLKAGALPTLAVPNLLR
jgi:hypothetical protein